MRGENIKVNLIYRILSLKANEKGDSLLECKVIDGDKTYNQFIHIQYRGSISVKTESGNIKISNEQVLALEKALKIYNDDCHRAWYEVNDLINYID